jgi:hypothetical protein
MSDACDCEAHRVEPWHPNRELIAAAVRYLKVHGTTARPRLEIVLSEELTAVRVSTYVSMGRVWQTIGEMYARGMLTDEVGDLGLTDPRGWDTTGLEWEPTW